MFNPNKTLRQILSIIFPPHCIVCTAHLTPLANPEILCEKCFRSIESLNGFYCPKCARRIPEITGRCHTEMPFIIAAATSFKNKAVPALIHAFKYKNTRSAEKILGEFLKTYYTKFVLPNIAPLEKWILIPIPLHPKKERTRGFNQTIRMYEFLATKKIALPPLAKNVLIRIKNTPSQTQCKSFEARAKNIKECFALQNTEIPKGKNILLLDDVTTSGATLNEATRMLKRAGARKIIGLVIAKA